MDPLSIFVGLVVAVIGIFAKIITNAENNRRAEEAEKAQIDYNKEALEKQAELNKEAAEYNYELETNYSDRMAKLQAAGINSHYAAQMLSGINSSYQPPMVSVNQARQKTAPDFSSLLQGMMTGVPNQIGQSESRQIQKDKMQMDNELQKQKIRLQKDIMEINRQVKDRELTMEEGRYKVWELMQYELVPNPLGKDYPDIPLWQAEAQSKGKQFQQDIELTEKLIEEKDVNLEELKKQVQRNDVSWQWEIERRAHERKMESWQVRELAAKAKILEHDASPKMLAVRFLLQYYEFLDKKQKAALQKQIENLPPGPGKEAAQTFIAFLPYIFEFIDKIPK